MNIKEIVFSPTGGTKAVADILARDLGVEPFSIDLTAPFVDYEQVMLSADDVVVIAMPCYCGRVPVLAAERFRRMNGNGARAVIVAVYGNRAYDDQLVEMLDLAKEAGFTVVAAVEAVAEHSIARDYAAGRPDVDDAKVLSGFAKEIADKLRRDDNSQPDVPGNRPYKEGPCGGMVPQANDNCVHCGECVEVCPNGAIAADNMETADPERCISCMRCIAVCPTHARSLDAAMLAGLTERLREVCSIRKDAKLYL